MVKQRRNADLDAVRTIALSIAGVEESTSSRGTGFKVGGKLLACPAIHKSAEQNSLMVRIDVDHRELLVAAEPEIYYVTDHYRGYPAILVRLSKVSPTALRELLENAVQFVSTKKKKRSGRHAP
jgi:hypothetical protein